VSAFCHLLNITKRVRDLVTEHQVLSLQMQLGMSNNNLVPCWYWSGQNPLSW
jgi:hypothetical protein